MRKLSRWFVKKAPSGQVTVFLLGDALILALMFGYHGWWLKAVVAMFVVVVLFTIWGAAVQLYHVKTRRNPTPSTRSSSHL